MAERDYGPPKLTELARAMPMALAMLIVGFVVVIVTGGPV